jgi:hypothetical protein
MSHLKTFLAAYLVRRLLEDFFLESDANLDHSIQVWRVRLVLARMTKISNPEGLRQLQNIEKESRKRLAHSDELTKQISGPCALGSTSQLASR